MIKYKFAKTKSEKIINIQDLSKEIRQSSDQFFCLGCENEMLPVLGNKRTKHFRHKQIEFNCQPETYLHKLAKLAFYQTYKNCLENKQKFFIEFHATNICNHYEHEFSIQCKWSQEPQEFEITQYFPEVQLETKVGKFIPDLVLSSNKFKNEKMFIEIAVTHNSSLEKIQSGNRIIEVVMQREEDIKFCQQSTLKESCNVRFFNFKKKIVKDYCKGQCYKKNKEESKGSISPTMFWFFVVLKDGSKICHCGSNELSEITKQKSFIYHSIIPSQNVKFYQRSHQKDWESILFRKEVVYAFLNGVEIKNCFLCRYHGIYDAQHDDKYTFHYRYVFCKLLKKSGNSNMAYQCNHFQADKNAFSGY